MDVATNGVHFFWPLHSGAISFRNGERVRQESAHISAGLREMTDGLSTDVRCPTVCGFLQLGAEPNTVSSVAKDM